MELAVLRDYIARTSLSLGDDTLAAGDATLIEQAIVNVHAQLTKIGVALWSLDDVPEYAVPCYGMLVKATLDSAFGFPADPALKAYAVRELRYLTADTGYGVGKATYF